MDNTVSFYDALAPMFDVMTDWDARLAAEGPFLRAILEEAGARTVLDAACGSGGHALWLARQGYRASGVDASPGMIALARQKAAGAGLDVPFVVSELGELATHLPPQPPSLQGKGEIGVPPLAGEGLGERFDAVLCLGNSLPHLLTQADLVAALRGMGGVLRPGGVLVLHNLNYDLRWRTQPRWFMAQGGLLEGEEVLVWRFADYDVPAGSIAFHIALFRKGAPSGGGSARSTAGASSLGAQSAGGEDVIRDWKAEVHTTPQRPLFRDDLLSALVEAGFGEGIRTYGRMAMPFEPFASERSGDLVVLAQKGR